MIYDMKLPKINSCILTARLQSHILLCFSYGQVCAMRYDRSAKENVFRTFDSLCHVEFENCRSDTESESHSKSRWSIINIQSNVSSTAWASIACSRCRDSLSGGTFIYNINLNSFSFLGPQGTVGIHVLNVFLDNISEKIINACLFLFQRGSRGTRGVVWSLCGVSRWKI